MPSGLTAVPLPAELPCYPSWKCPKFQPAVLGFALGCQLRAVGSLTGNWIETPKNLLLFTWKLTMGNIQ